MACSVTQRLKIAMLSALLWGTPLVAHSVDSDTSTRHYLADYKPYPFTVPQTILEFDIRDSATTVHSHLRVVPQQPGEPLVLDGENQTLLSIVIDGEPVYNYQLTDSSLTIFNVPQDPFWLEVVSTNVPSANTACSGLYTSGDVWVTQCESQGFRRITYFPDRPDVLSRYIVSVTADKAKCPILLSNGNQIGYAEQEDRHAAVFQDPYMKPSYLFALVAGDMGVAKDRFVTASGRNVAIECYVPKGLETRVDMALLAARQAMAWDEEHFNREYDCDTLRIVGVDRFNAGAMENKSLLIFNSQYLIGDTDIAPDSSLTTIQAVIGHEYFHNWSGNRVSPRDWFQLTLKEGLTTFREQEFMYAVDDALVQRISDVRVMLSSQFAEDAGPNAHPIQPQAYEEIGNFYTTTVYEKGAEFYRMLQTLFGKETFEAAVSYYFDAQDGQPTTLQDFCQRMEEATGEDLTQFRRWITQAGTPEVTVTLGYDESAAAAALFVTQTCRPTPETAVKLPFDIPLRVAFYDARGNEVISDRILRITEPTQTFIFGGLYSRPILSLNRGFSAPVKVNYDYTPEELGVLVANDTDLFNRWSASQQLMTCELQGLMNAYHSGQQMKVGYDFLRVLAAIVEDENMPPAAKAEFLTPPSAAAMLQAMPTFDFEALFAARKALRQAIANRFESHFVDIYNALSESSSIPCAGTTIVAQRKLKNTALSYLVAAGHTYAAIGQYRAAQTMEDRLVALQLLLNTGENDWVLSDFIARWRNHEAAPLVMNLVLAAVARADRPDVISLIEKLEQSDFFDRTNPNNARYLWRVFAANLQWFNDASGSGYRFLADRVIAMSQVNSGVAGALTKAFGELDRLDSGRQALVREELARIAATPDLPSNIRELIGNTL